MAKRFKITIQDDPSNIFEEEQEKQRLLSMLEKEEKEIDTVMRAFQLRREKLQTIKRRVLFGDFEAVKEIMTHEQATEEMKLETFRGLQRVGLSDEDSNEMYEHKKDAVNLDQLKDEKEPETNWNNLPEELKVMIIKELDITSRFRLGFCSNFDQALVSRVKIKTNSIDISPNTFELNYEEDQSFTVEWFNHPAPYSSHISYKGNLSKRTLFINTPLRENIIKQIMDLNNTIVPLPQLRLEIGYKERTDEFFTWLCDNFNINPLNLDIILEELVLDDGIRDFLEYNLYRWPAAELYFYVHNCSSIVPYFSDPKIGEKVSGIYSCYDQSGEEVLRYVRNATFMRFTDSSYPVEEVKWWLKVRFDDDSITDLADVMEVVGHCVSETIHNGKFWRMKVKKNDDEIAIILLYQSRIVVCELDEEEDMISWLKFEE